jgi:hypothetical protein
MKHPALFLLLLLPGLSGCGQTFEEKRAEALAAEPTIAPGLYGNVQMSGETGDLGGMELSLPQGSDSATAEFVFCEGWCNTVEQPQVRRGLGGVAFTIRYAERDTDISVQPAGANAVTVSVDWGNGLQQYQLPRIARPFGLDVARDNEANLPR